MGGCGLQGWGFVGVAMAGIICRFEDKAGRILWGQPCASDEQGLPAEAQLLAVQDPYGDLALSDEKVAVVKLLAPVEPKNIICIGLNYRKHAAESNMPVPQHPIVFHKAVSTLQHPLEPIEIPKIETKVDWEVELAIVIGRRCKDVTVDAALDCVAGYTVGNDVSGRYWQLEKGGGQWCFGKSFDTFTPLGPVLVTPAVIKDPQTLQVRTTIDGELLQDSNTLDMVFSCAEIIAFLSQGTTLLPGTVILTGTPFGVGLGLKPQRWLQPGQTVTTEIDGIGKLTNPVQAAS
jgi:2-keto-4-pentenoate hydratase/2-oxohepta-3-ene-1,7-dioic acid hydratase in catechol pathway